MTALTEPHSCQAVLLNVSQPAFQGKQNPDLYLFSNFPGVNTHPVAHFKGCLIPRSPELNGWARPALMSKKEELSLLWSLAVDTGTITTCLGGDGGKKWVD